MEKGGWVYIMSNKPDGTLYIGVTSDLARRVYEHRSGSVGSFSKRYNLQRLVYAERHDGIEQAIQREGRLKKWPRLEDRSDRFPERPLRDACLREMARSSRAMTMEEAMPLGSRPG